MKKITLIFLALFMGATVMAQAPKHYCLLKGKVKTIVENDHIFYSFNEAGAVTKVEIMENGKRRTMIACEYNDKGQLVKETRKILRNDKQLELYECSSEENYDETFIYENDRLVKSYTKGSETHYSYGAKGKLAKTVITFGSDTKRPSQSSLYKYNTKGRLISGGGTTYKYNTKGLLIASVSGDETTKYNGQGLVSDINGYDYNYTFKYNDKNNVIEEHEDAVGYDTTTKYTYEYDAQNNWVSRLAKGFEGFGGYDYPDKTTTRIITYY